MTELRFSIYRPIDKAMRHLLFSRARQIGLADFSDDEVTQETLAILDRTLGFLQEHRDMTMPKSIPLWKADCLL
ncbi:MAG: hypothetical protein MK125_08105 [Dehalococcoidia bacterium]|nr:hypothetical protein [Dehalococcoidia bacterium]